MNVLKKMKLNKLDKFLKVVYYFMIDVEMFVDYWNCFVKYYIFVYRKIKRMMCYNYFLGFFFI